MGQSSRQTRLDRLRGVGISGSMSRSQSGSETARNRRGAQREGEFSQRFLPDEFELDSEGRVTLKTTSVAGVAVMGGDTVDWHSGSSSPSAVTDIGYTGGPRMDTAGNEVFGHWSVPADCDRTKAILLSVYLAQIGTVSDAFTVDVEVYPYSVGDNYITEDGSPAVTLDLDGTTSTTSGDSHDFQNMEITAAQAFPDADVRHLTFHAHAITMPSGNGDLAWVGGCVHYWRSLTPATHKHE